MMNEGDPPPPQQQEPEAQAAQAPAAPEPGRAEGSAAFLRAARAGTLDKVLELLRAGTDINTSNANGLNSLHLASKEGHSEVVRELIKRNAQVDAATRKGNTALHIASLAGQSLIVTILVENGANVNVQSVNGFTPLYMAAQENHEDVVRYLLNHGANQALSTEDGFTPLAVALQQGHDRVVAVLLENDAKGKVRLPALHIAAKKDDTKAATLLLQNEHNPDVTSKSGFTPLHIAAHYGHENVGQLLLDKGANVNYQARHNISPLHVATKWGRTNMANLLLSRGAIIDSRTKDLLTPLHCAARSGHDQVVDLLVVQGAPISAKTKNGLAPLHMAAQGDHVDAARTLLYHRAPVDDVTVDYLTPLHVAAHCGHVKVAKLLLDRSADPNSRALNGFTPLHIACKKNRIKVVELLLKYRAAIEATTESGLTPLHVAAFMGAINIVIYLLQQGANPDVETVRGETPLHLAARANQTDVVRVLIRNQAKVDAQARELQTPLHIASRLGNTDIVVLLLQAGANANATTRDNYSPLHIAAKEGQEEVASILLDHGADKSLLTKKGFTPLHLASKYGNLEVVRLLLERGTPVDIEGKNQVTPLHVAAHYNNDKVAMLLLENGASAKAAAKNGYTPLHIAAKKNQMEIASTLLQFNADPNAKSRAGFTPLHLAAQEGHKEISGLLFENGSDVGAKANNGLTAMHLCAQEDHVPVAQILHDSGAEINSKTNAGYTPLHVACHFGQLNMVKFLVEHGADVGEKTRASYTPLHQAAQQGHNNCVRYLLENGASPNEQTATGQTPLSIAQRLGYVSVVETLRTVTETTVITETTTVDERYKPQNPEAMNETMFSESEDEGQAAEHEAEAAHAKDFSDNLTQGLQDSTGVHMIHTGEQLLNRSQELENGGAIPKINSGGMSPEKEFAKIAPVATSSPIATSHSQPLGIAPRAGSISGQFQHQPLHGAGPEDNLEELVRRAQNHPIQTGNYDSGAAMLENGHADNVPIGHHVTQPSFLISFLVDARGGAMRGCRHSGVRIIVPPRKASQPIRVTCRYLRKDKLAHPPPLSEGEELASRILEMAPAGAKFLGPVILEVPHFASLRDREREIVILRSDDGQHWKEHQLEATEDAVQEVLNESFDAEDLAQLDDLQTPRITRILTSDFPMYFAVVTRVRQEVHCVGPEGGVIISSVVPRVQAIFPDGSLTKTIKVSVQAQPVPQEMVTRLHGNRVAVSPIVTVEPRRRKFHKPITLCIPLPQSNNKGMLTQYSGQQGQEPPTLRLLCSITGGSAPAQWEDITGTTQLTFTGDEVSFTTTVSARFWLMDCQTPRDAARMAQEVYNEAISIPYMAKFAVFARRTFPVEGQLRVFCMTDDKEDKTLEKQEHFKLIAKSRDVEVLKGKHQFLEFSGNLVPITKSGDQLSLFFLPFQENRLAFMVKTRSKDDTEAATEGRLGFMAEPKIRSDALPPQQPICTLAISLPEYTGEIKPTPPPKKDSSPFEQRYGSALEKELPEFVHQNVLKGIGADWPRLGRALEVPHRDIQHIRHNYPGQECKNTLKIWIHLKKEDANQDNLDLALRQIGRDDIVRSIAYGEPEALINYSQADSPSQKREPIRHFEDVPTATLVKREVRTEDLVTREPIQPTHHVEQSTTVVQEPSYSAPVHHSPVPEEPELEEEAPVAEMRTVVRTERHVHDTEEGPVVEERTITTTYEDDVAVNENIVDRTVPLNDEERKKWEELNRLADESSPSPAQRSSAVAESTSEQVPEDVEQSVESESHREDDGTIVTTTVTTSHISESPLGSPTRSEEPEERRHSEHHDEASGAEQHSGQDSGTTQKKETAEEGFTNEDGSVVVSKKMTRVVTTTRTTLPGEGEEPSAPDSPVESLGSVKDRIAKFEQFKTLPIDPSVSGPPPSVHSLPQETEEEPEYEQEPLHTHEEIEQVSETQGRDSGRSDHSEQSIPEVQFTESDTEIEHHHGDEQHEETYLEPTVGIVITPHTPVPPEHPEEKEEYVEDEQPQDPLEPSEPEHVARAEIKDTREYSDEELAHELSPSEEHVSTAEIKDIKSYSPTSSDDERASQKGKVSPPIPQARHVISPSVASEVISSHDDELAAHFVAESFEKQDEGSFEVMEQTPIYRGHHSPGQTSPIVSEHPLAQEYAESVTSHDEGDNLSLKSGHEAEIARHSVASVQEEEEEDGKPGLGDYAKKAGMIVGGVIAAPVALAAVGAKAAYDALKKDDDEHEEKPEGHEEKEVLTTQTTIMESPIQHEDIPAPHMEDVTPKVSHHEHPHEVVTETTTTVTREYYEQPEREESPVPSSHVESERPTSPSEKEPSHVVTETTTIVTREYEPEHEVRAVSPTRSEEGSERHFVTETTTTTTVTKEYEQPEDSERLSEPAQSPEPVGTLDESEKSIPHVVETTTTTTVTREFYDDEDQPEPVHREASPLESPVASERSIRSVQQQESPRHSPVPSEPISEKDAHHVTETTTTTTVTREYYDEPQEASHSPAPSSHQESEQAVPESPVITEKELPHVIETTTTTTVTREFEEEPDQEPEHHQEISHHVEAPATRDVFEEEYPRPESPAEVYPIPSEKEQEHHLVSETTTTTTVTREYYDEPEQHEGAAHPDQELYKPSESPAQGSPVPSEKDQEHHFVKETTTTTTVTREFHDDEYDRPESPLDVIHKTGSPAPSTETEHRELESPAVSEKEVPHVTERTTTTTVTREYFDNDYDKPEFHPSDTERQAPELPVTQQFHQESEYPAAQYSHEESQDSHHQQPESGEESDGEGFGSKVLGFAKKAGMVAGGVVAAPVALAAVGAKAAYDALKKDDEEEGEEGEHRQLAESPVREARDFHEEEGHKDQPSHSPAPSSDAESEHVVPDSPVVETTTTTSIQREYRNEEYQPSPDESPMEQQQPWATERTTTTTVTREFYDEPEEHSHSPAPSSHVESEHPVSKSPALSEKDYPTGVETTTTTTVAREYEQEPEAEHFEQKYDEPEFEERRSPSPAHSQEHLVKETTTTTTVTREFYDEPEHVQEHQEESFSPAPSSHVESEHQVPKSPALSEAEHPHVIETTTTTTVTREFHDDEYDRPESPLDVIHKTGSPIPSPEHEAEHRDLESPAVSEREVPHVTETTTTTTVTREYYDDEDQYRQELPVEQAELEQEHRSPSPVRSEEGSVKHFITETTTTTTVTKEYEHPEDSERLSETTESQEQEVVGTPAVSEKSIPHVVETTTTTTVTSEFYQEEEPIHHEGSAVHQPFAQEQGEYPVSPRASPVPSEKLELDDVPLVKETTTTTTVTQEYEQEPEAEQFEQRYDEPEFEERRSPSPAHSQEHLVKETTTTTTVTREFYDEPEHVQEHQQESFSPAPSSHVESEHQVPESPAVSEKELPHVTETALTHDSPAAQYFREEQEHYVESPVQTEKAPLLTEQQQPESGEESDGEGFGSKVLGFAKKAGMVAGGVVAAPVALAAVGAKAAYDALKKDEEEEDQDEQEALLEDVRERRAVDSPADIAATTEHLQESPVSSEVHHVTETTTTTTVTREYFDEAESPIPSHEAHDQKSVEGSQKSIPHVVETTTTTTVTRDFDEPSPAESPVPSEKEEPETKTTTREVFEAAEGDEPAHHYIETTTTTVKKDVFDEPEEALDDDEPKQESPHVVETTTTTKTTREYDDEEEGSETGAPHVTETTTTTTVVREFYGETPEDQEHPDEEESAPAQIEQDDVSSPGSESTTSVSREVHPDEPHVVETTTTTTITREYHDEPEESEDAEVKETTTTTTVTREYYEEEPESPTRKEQLEDDRASPVESERSVPQEMEHDVVRDIHSELRQESPVGQQQEEQHRAASPTKSEEGSERPFISETTTTTTFTREFEHPEHEFDSERLSEPTQSPQPVGTPAESEKSIPHVVETTTTTTVTREFYDDEEQPQPAAHDELSPVLSEQRFDQEQQRDSTIAERGSPVPSEKFEHDEAQLVKETTTTTTVTREYEQEPEAEHFEQKYDEPEFEGRRSPSPDNSQEHLVKETTTTTTVTREFYDEPEHVQERQESFSPAPSSHVESEHQVPESPAVSEKELPHVTRTSLTQDSPAAHYFHEEQEYHTESPVQTEKAPLLTEQQQPESGEESDGEGFGSKVLGFAKKAGMVAGGVVAAPVALAAVGAKAAYDALKKDDEEEDQDEPEALLGDVREQRSAGSPIKSEAYHQFEESEQRFQESPYGETARHTMETTTTTVSQEFHEEPESPVKFQPAHAEDQESLKSPTVSEKEYQHDVAKVPSGDERDQSSPASPVHSHKDDITQFQDEESPESVEKYTEEEQKEDAQPEFQRQGSYSPGYSPKSPRGSLAESDEGSHQVIETVTSSVTEEHFKQEEQPREEQKVESPVPSKEGSAKFIETTTTTTTVNREHFEPEDEQEPHHVVESQRYDGEFPIPSEEGSSRVIETTTTTTVTKEHFEPKDEQDRAAKTSEYSPSGSPVPSEKSVERVVETTTTTTVTREYFEEEQAPSPVQSEDKFEEDRDHYSDEPAIAPYQQPTEYGRVDSHDAPASPAPSAESPIQRDVHGFEQERFDSERLSEPAQSPEPVATPAESEKSIPHVVETTTTTTVTSEFYDEEEQPEPARREESPVHSEQSEAKQQVPESPTEHVQEHQKESFSPAPSSHVDSEHQVPESPAVSEKELPHVTRTSLTQDSPAAQYFHEEQEYHSESPVQTEKAPLLTEQQQPESGEESDGEGFGSKVLGFAKKAGMVAGGVVAAPVALAAVGAKAAYDALKKDDEEKEDQDEQEALLGDVREQRSAGSPIKSEAYHQFEEPEQRFQESPYEVREQHDKPEEPSGLVSPVERRTLADQVSEEDTASEGPEPEYASPVGSTSEQSQHYTEVVRKTTVTREYLDDDELQQPEGETRSRADSIKQTPESPSQEEPYVVETTTTVIRHYHDEPKTEEESEEKTLPEEVTVLREVYEAPEGNEPEHHYIETKTTTTITKEVYAPTEAAAPGSPVHSEKDASETDFPIRDTLIGEPHPGDTVTTTVTREYYQEPEGVRPASGSEADDESHAPRYMETTTTTTVTREYEVSEDDEEETHPEDKQHQLREESPVPSEESVSHVVEKITTTTVTEERYEPEEGHSDEDIPESTTTTTTTTTVTREHFEPEGEHVVESHEYQSESPVPSEQDSHRYIEKTTTTTTVTHEHIEPEDDPEHLPVVESRVYSPSGSPTPSEKSEGHFIETTTTTTITREHVHQEDDGSFTPGEHSKHHESDQPESHSPVPSEGETHDFIKTTTTTTTVTREHFEAEDEHPSEGHAAEIPSDDESSHVIETTTTTTVTKEHFEPEDHPDQHHVVEPQEYSPAGSPVTSEKSIGHVVEPTTTTTALTREHFESEEKEQTSTVQDSPAAQYFHEEQEYHSESPVQTEKAPLLTEQQQQPESGEESDGEGFGSKVLGFAKKAGMVAGGVVAAPVALATVGAKAAYDALKKDDEEKDQDEQEALLGDVREHRALDSPVDSKTQQHGATFYEPEEEDKVVVPESKEEEPKIVFPVDTPADQYVKEKEAFESMVQAEGPYIIESEEYEATEHQEPRISSPVHSDSGDIQTSPQQEQDAVEEETPRPAEISEADAPYIIDSEEYEFTDREEPRISSPAHSDEEERQEAGIVGIGDYDAQQQNQEEAEEDPSIVESEEYTGSGQGSPRPFEDSTTTTVLSVHHEPPAIPEPEVDEEEFERDRSVIESGEYSQGSQLPPTSVTSVEHVQPSEEQEHTATSPTTVTTVTSEHFEQDKDPYVVESEEYTRASPIGHERPESPSGSPTHDDSHVIESQEYSGSPVPSEDSVRHVVEKVTTVTTNEEHFEPEDSSEDVYDHVKTTTTTTTVTREHFEPEEEEHIVESREYESGSPVPSEKESSQVIETVTTTTVVREHFEPEDDQEEPHIVESQEYSPTGSPAPSDKHEPHLVETTTTTFETRERVEPEEERAPSPADSQRQPEIHSPVPSEEDVHGYIKTTTTTTTVTREHFEPEEEHVVESEKYTSGSPVPSEEDSNRGYETTTTTTVTREEHFEPEEEQHHIVESQEYSPSGSPVPSEKSVGHVIETTTTTTITRKHVEPEQEYFHSESGRQSPVPSEKSVQRVIETSILTTETRERFEPEEERQVSPVPSEEEVHGFVKTTSDITTESHVEPEHFEKEQESGEESDGEGFGSKVLGFAKKAGMVAGGVVAAPVALAAVGAKAAYDALKKDDEEEGEHGLKHREEPVNYESDLQKPAPTIETHQEKDDSESEGSFVDHGEESQHLPLQSTEAAFKLSTEDVAEQTAEKLVSEVFSPLDRTLKESEEYRASMESLNRRSPVESKRSVEDLASEALQNVTKISFGHADDSDDKHDDHDEEWKVYDRHGEILEEFSTQLTDDVIQEAEGDATTQIMMTQAEYSPRRSKFLKQESCQEISNEPEVDYYSDLQEKLNILAGEKNNLHALVEEEPSSSASDQLDVIHESDQEAHLEQEHQKEADAQKEQEEKEEAAEYTATHLVDDVLQQVVHEINEEDDDQKTMTSDAYLTATEKDDQEYDTCVTSQDDTYESAQGWTSQDSEYTTATSQAPSRLSDSDGEHTARDRDQERQETSTPQAILSPVDSDRHFTVQQDFDMPVIRAFDPDDFMQNTARSTPDVALQVTIEEEDESDDKLPISPSGILLPPSHDPGRPISPVPPRKSDGTMQKEGDHFVFVREEDTIAEPTPPPQPAEFVEEVRKTPEAEEEETRITRENVPQEEEETEMRRQETERIHSLAMEASSDLGNSESSRYSRQLSDLSSSAESHADTVIRVESERSGSSDSLEVVSVISAGKDARTSEKSLTPEDQEKPLEAEKAQKEKEHPEEHHERPEQEAEDLGFEVYDADTEEQQQPVEELETVEEEPEDSDSLNEGGNHSSGHSSVGVPADTLAMIGKYRHQSSDNLSLTSLQEFERLEKEVGARGDGSLTRSEIELLVAGRLNRSGEGSVSSLAEFERLEKEMTENQSPPEDVMMLSDIREESEAEDMSIRDDDEEDVVGSDTELKSRPVQEEDLRVITPVAPSPTDSLEHAVDPIQMQYLETSTDSLEPTFQEIEVEQRPESVEDTSLTEYEMVPRVMEASTTDSLDGTATIERDSVLEGASQGIESTQSTHGLLSGDTMGTVVTDDDRDSLDGEVSSMLQSYPTTLTTFQTTVVGPDGSLQTISRRVETRVTDPLISHVTFTGTESQERLDQLPDDEQFETVDTEGNVTRTTFHREHDQQPHPHF